MKKLFVSLLVAATMSAFAQVEDPDVMIIHFKDGTQTVVDITDADYLEFTNAPETPETPDPDDPDNPDPDDPDDPNKPDPDDPNKPDPDDPEVPDVPLPDPKVGDYFYSDGTWSDGGLISIDADGNSVWADAKPAPLPGKTVIGIVFNTNPDRMAESEKQAGYTHGYVIGCKNITDPKKKNFDLDPESVWFAGQYAYVNGYVQVNKVSKIASSCYSNIDGYTETKTLFDKNDPKYYDEDIPMFWYGAKAYHVEAPENTSGWFIPSIGQMWDCVANFCGGEVAAFLKANRTNTTDFTYYCSKKDLGTSPYELFARAFEGVPPADKDEMTIPDNGSFKTGNPTINLATSTRYDDESRVIISLGMAGYPLVEGMAAWFDEETHARPILAF